MIEQDERGPAGGSGYAFKHVLVRDVAYGSLDKVERLGHHDRLGRWLEQVAGGQTYADVIAHHAEQAFALAHELGRAEASELGPRAVDLLEAAISRARDHDDRHAVLGLCARALAVGGDAGVPPAALTATSAIVSLTEHQLAGTPESRRGLAASADELRAAGPSPLLVELLILLGNATAGEHPRHAAARYDEALLVAQEVGDPMLVLQAMVAPKRLAFLADDEDWRERVVVAAQAYRREHGLGWVVTDPLRDLADQAAIRGGLSDARALWEEYERLLRATSPSALIARYSLRWRLHFALDIGDYEAAVTLAEGYLPLCEQLGDRAEIAYAKAILGKGAFELGDAKRARKLHAEALEFYEGSVDPAFRNWSRFMLARDLVALGEREDGPAQAERAYADVYAEVPEQRQSQGMVGAVLAEARAADGRVAEAEALFREALATLEPTRYSSDAADIRVRFAAFLRSLGRNAEARVQLEAARDFYSNPLAFRRRERIDALLAQAASGNPIA